MKKALLIPLIACSLNIFSQTAGCTDSLACNYDPLATIDDGSCQLLFEDILHQLFDINTLTESASPYHITAVGNDLYFKASDGVNGYELWKYDIALGSATMLADIYPGSSSSSPAYVTAAGNDL